MPTNLYLLLATADDVPGSDTNLVSDLTEISLGNGYATGGIQLNLNDVDFDTLIEDDGTNQGKIGIKDLALVASGGSIPSSGDGASYYILTDDKAPIANREVIAFWSTASPVFVSDGQTHTISNLFLVSNES